MANDVTLPNARTSLVDGKGLPTDSYRKFFEKLSRQTGLTTVQQAEITQILARLDALEDEDSGDLGQILGLGSVSAVGALDSQVILQLEGDEEAPAATHYYGTDETGVRGFHERLLTTNADVDAVTVPFASGDAVIFDGTNFVPGAILANPMTTLGDIITGDVGGTPKRLAAGADGDVLTMVGGEPAYAPVPAPPAGASRGITVTGGSIGGADIPVSQVIGGLAASDYTLTGNWYLWCSPTGSIEIDVRKSTFGAIPPGPGDSICGGNEPAVVGGISASGTFAGWSPSISRDDALSVIVNSNTSVTWFVLLMEAV